MKDETGATGLQLDVSSALPTIGDKKTVVGAARLVLEDGYDVAFEAGEDVAWRLEVRRIAGGIEVTGYIEGVITLQCYRCLEGFEFPLALRVREHALWLSEAEAEEEEEPVSEYMVTDGILDLETVIRDSVCLTFPAKRVCGESCKGLCTNCGANLNIEPCGCDTRVIDARLKPLEELKKRLEGNE